MDNAFRTAVAAALCDLTDHQLLTLKRRLAADPTAYGEAGPALVTAEVERRGERFAAYEADMAWLERGLERHGHCA